MKWMDPSKRREYYAKYKRVNVKNDQGWFEVYELPGKVYAICEPQHYEEVNAFLAIGSESALLIDTGMGVCDISRLVTELWDGPLSLVNTHSHFDHTGGNYLYSEAWGVDEATSRRIASEGISGSLFGQYLDEDMFLLGYPEGFKPEEYRLRPYRLKPCEDGHIFELGDRKLEFISTPGHTKDSAMLYDHKNKILFTGDMFYLGGLCLMFDSPEFGLSSFEDYIASIEKVFKRCPDVEKLYVSHNDFIADAAYLNKLLKALKEVHEGRAKGKPLENVRLSHGEDPSKLLSFDFEGFSIAVHERFL